MSKIKQKLFHKAEKLDKITKVDVRVEDEDVCPDGGYGWVVCLAAAIIQFIILGVHNSFGILYTYLMDDLRVDPTDTAWVGSIAFGMNFLCGPITSSLCQRYGCRIVSAVGGLIAVVGLLLTSFASNLYIIYITYSLLWGFGSSLNYAPTMLILGQYFRKHLPLANGIVTAGSGVGTMAMGPLYHLVLSNLGWRMLLRIISCVAFLMFVCALFYRPLPAKYQRNEKTTKEDSKCIDLSVWKMKPFVVWVVSMSMLFVGYFVPFIHLPNHARNLGISAAKTSFLIGYLSIASTVSRVLFGLILNHPRVNRFYVLQLCFLMMSVTCTLCPLATNYVGLILYAVSFGSFDGCFVLLIAVTTSDIVGPGKLPQALGGLYGVIAFPMIFGPPLAGFLFKLSGSYQNAFFVAGGAIFVGTCMLSLIPFFMGEGIATEIEVDENSSPDEDLTKNSEETSYAPYKTNRSGAFGQRDSLVYDTRNFALGRSFSSLALGRLGEMYGIHYILEMLDRETCV